jgi:hypothetical protein
LVLRSATTASSSTTSGQTASNLPAACGAGAVTCTTSAPRKVIHLPPHHAATADWRKEKNAIPPITGAADTRRRRCRRRSRREHPKLQRGGCSLPTSPLQACPPRRRSEAEQEQQQPQSHQGAGPATMEPRVPEALPQHEQLTTGQSLRATNVNSLHLDKMLRVVVAVVQQIMK